MLSILIPVYNFDVTELVNELNNQAKIENVPYEIILMDDASDNNFKNINKSCEQINNVTYIELPSNIGRAKIRNKLASMSKYDNLLFIDCDSKIFNDFYIESYLNNLNDNLVLCGGRIYEISAPVKKELYLRWLYGTKRECANAGIRNINPNNSFMTNNFIISKSLIQKLQFDENIENYGHEDTLFGIELKKNNITIKHIDNPLIHIGLESSDEFIEKTKEGISNLVYILKYYKDKNQLISGIKLLKWYYIVNKLLLNKPVLILFKISEKYLLKNLKSKNPKLLFFDFYKLGYLCSKINVR